MKEYIMRLKDSYNTGLALTVPQSASVPLTADCNSRCQYCPPERTAQENNPSLVDLRELFHQLHRLGVKNISLTGGEPTLRKDLEDIIRAAVQHELNPTLLTNGTLLSEKRLVSLIEAGIQGIVMSLDSLSPNTYKEIRGVPLKLALNGIEALTLCKRNYPRVFTCITSVITNKNILDLPSIASYLSQRDLHYQIQPVLRNSDLAINPTDSSAIASLRMAIRSILDIYIPRYSQAEIAYTSAIPDYIASGGLPENFRCFAMFQLIHLDVDFNVYPCWLFPAVGTIKNTPLENIWFGEEMHNARLRLKNNGCSGCWLLCDAKPSIQYNL